MASRGGSPLERQLQRKSAEMQLGALAAIRSWFAFTLGSDTDRTFYRVPHVLVNWAAIAGLTAGAVLRPGMWQVWAALATAGLLYTIGRGARQLPARRKALQQLFTATKRSHKHPNGTVKEPVSPASYVRISRWRGAGIPTDGVVIHQPGSAAALLGTRGLAERDIEQQIKLRKGKALVFDHDTPGQIAFATVAEDDPRVEQRRKRIWIDQTLNALFPKAGEDLRAVINWGEGTTITAIDVDFGPTVQADKAFRADCERRFDTQVRAGGEWVYDWTVPGQVTITNEPSDSLPARRKRVTNKVVDVLTGTIAAKGGRGAFQQIEVTIDEWLPEGAGDDSPTLITAQFGTVDLSLVDKQYAVMDDIDRAMAQMWPDRVWLPEWRLGYGGHLQLTAVPTGSVPGQRKTIETMFRRIITPQFGRATGVSVEVLEWGESGGQPAIMEAVVDYGNADMSSPDSKRKVEDALDTRSMANDWRYDWYSDPGKLGLKNVPKLPDFIAFPQPGTPELVQWHEDFRNGIWTIGPAKGGFITQIKWNKSPHCLAGGTTGAGKSFTIGTAVYGVLMNPDHFNLIAVDPKVTDFTWLAEYPNVIAYAPFDVRRNHEQIREAVKIAYDAMNRRQMMLQEHQCRNMQFLRSKLMREYGCDTYDALLALAKAGGIPDIETDDLKRLFILFDEGGAAFTPVKNNPDAKELQDESRTWMEQIGMLGRAMEVNIIMAAQKPSADNIGTAMRAQMPNRLGVGNLKVNESIQVMGSDILTRLPDGAPKGRGYFVNDEGQELLFQTYYLPNDNEPCPTDPDTQLVGIREQVAERLTDLGYVSVKVPRKLTVQQGEGDDAEIIEKTIMVDSWVRADRIDSDDPGDEDHGTDDDELDSPLPAPPMTPSAPAPVRHLTAVPDRPAPPQPVAAETVATPVRKPLPVAPPPPPPPTGPAVAPQPAPEPVSEPVSEPGKMPWDD